MQGFSSSSESNRGVSRSPAHSDPWRSPCIMYVGFQEITGKQTPRLNAYMPDFPEVREIFKERLFALENMILSDQWAPDRNASPFRSASPCFACGVEYNAGSRTEFKFRNGIYVWPDGLSHLLDHGLGVPESFFQMVLNETTFMPPSKEEEAILARI